MADAEKPLAGEVEFVHRPEAPIIVFDTANTIGSISGLVRISLSVGIYLPGDGNTPNFKIATVAHLVMHPAAIRSLQSALEKGLLLTEKPETDAKN